MGRRLFLLAAALTLVLAQAGIAMAGVADTGPGCGLGKELWKDTKDTDTVGHHLLISTTNNPIFPLQAGGITTGSWGCKNNRKIWTEEKTNYFAAIHLDNLSQDMAQGGGEHLASLATLLGISPENQAAFFALAQERYVLLLQAGESDTAALLKALNDAMASHPVLAQVSSR